MFTGTLRYNVEYPMRLKGVPAAERKSRAGELMRAVNLERLAESPAHSLSGGEAQRASIARALAAGAQAILFDEPTASVDHRSRGDLINLIRDLWKDRGLSLLVTTHDARLAAELCHEHIFLMDGRVVPQTLLSDSAAAWPAGLRTENGRPVLSLPPQAREALFGGREAPRTDFPALAVSGLAELAAGVSLRLSPPRGNPVDVLLSDGVSRECARRLSLGDAVHLEAQ